MHFSSIYITSVCFVFVKVFSPKIRRVANVFIYYKFAFSRPQYWLNEDEAKRSVLSSAPSRSSRSSGSSRCNECLERAKKILEIFLKFRFMTSECELLLNTAPKMGIPFELAETDSTTGRPPTKIRLCT